MSIAKVFKIISKAQIIILELFTASSATLALKAGLNFLRVCFFIIEV